MRRTRPQHPRCSARGRPRPANPAQTALCPGPEALSQLREERATARFPRLLAYLRVLWEGRGAAWPRQGAGAAAASLPPSSLGRSPDATSSLGDARLSPPGVGRATCRLGPRPKLCAGRNRSRSSSGRTVPTPKCQPWLASERVGRPAPPLYPHLPPLGPPRPGSSPTPPLARPQLQPPPPRPPPRAGGGENRLPSPGAGSAVLCASSLGPRRNPGLSTAASAAPERQNLVGEAAATTVSSYGRGSLLRVGASCRVRAKEPRGCPPA